MQHRHSSIEVLSHFPDRGGHGGDRFGKCNRKEDSTDMHHKRCSRRPSDKAAHRWVLCMCTSTSYSKLEKGRFAPTGSHFMRCFKSPVLVMRARWPESLHCKPASSISFIGIGSNPSTPQRPTIDDTERHTSTSRGVPSGSLCA